MTDVETKEDSLAMSGVFITHSPFPQRVFFVRHDMDYVVIPVPTDPARGYRVNAALSAVRVQLSKHYFSMPEGDFTTVRGWEPITRTLIVQLTPDDKNFKDTRPNAASIPTMPQDVPAWAAQQRANYRRLARETLRDHKDSPPWKMPEVQDMLTSEYKWMEHEIAEVWMQARANHRRQLLQRTKELREAEDRLNADKPDTLTTRRKTR